MAQIQEHEDGLRSHIEEQLAAFGGVTVYSRAAHRTPTLLVELDGCDSQEVYRFLGSRGVNAPAGTFYAYETSRHLGLGDRGALRIGLAPYNNLDDVSRLMEGLKAFLSDAS
jgi:selenocysteine lyase/cysteine desulfurase